MTQPQWEEIDVPKGAYISWGTQVGQHVTGNVIGYSHDGGSDFNGNTCPQVSIELTADAASVNKEGVRTNFAAGELVVLNAGQVSLRRAVVAAQLAVGDLVKIELVNLVKVEKGTVKEFSIKVARGAGKSSVQHQPEVTPEPPF